MAVWKIKTEYIAGENQAIYLSTAQLLKASAEKIAWNEIICSKNRFRIVRFDYNLARDTTLSISELHLNTLFTTKACQRIDYK